jgi:CheY-like chemotaxis protein
VKDTGVGISPDKQQRIFESFSQADRSTARRFGGSGLGLAISSRLVGLMDGRIWVESEPGRGSTFHFTARLGLETNAAPPATTADWHDLPVLLADDNTQCRRVWQELLAHQGMRVHATADATGALLEMDRAADAGAPVRLAIIDADLPGTDGWTLTESLRNHQRHAACPIIVLVPASQAGIPAACRRLAAVQFLTKPAKHSELAEAMAVALGVRDDAPAGGDTMVAGVRPLEILLAEDGIVNQEVAVGLLEMRGHHVEVANNGFEVLEALERRTFDVVLMDLEMPDMDGFETTAAVREKESYLGGHVPIVAMTAHAIKGFREQCLAAGMDDFVTKPIKPEEMYRAVETVVLEPPVGTAQ